MRTSLSPAPIKHSPLIGDFSIKQFICDSRFLEINNQIQGICIGKAKGKWLPETAFRKPPYGVGLAVQAEQAGAWTPALSHMSCVISVVLSDLLEPQHFPP